MFPNRTPFHAVGLERGIEATLWDVDSDGGAESKEVLEALMAAPKRGSRTESEVARSIGVQLAHMDLTSWSISIRRRVRDIVLSMAPDRILEVGAGIGHLSAWLYDAFEDSPPARTTWSKRVRSSVSSSTVSSLGMMQVRGVASSAGGSNVWQPKRRRNLHQLVRIPAPSIRSWRFQRIASSSMSAGRRSLRVWRLVSRCLHHWVAPHHGAGCPIGGRRS